ncbi:unnamed protein product [Microthlaspi erraticum]|uniref:Uncharacterized protein n=1 Tax=Microthlaspi erraticum TaxID=1685480 RepID=A0A6D2JHR6_9BRAS|nr:unnamed protein product [Microthlaspi erraticum]
MMAGNLWRTWPYQQNAMESTMKVQMELDRALDRAGRSDEKRHACTQLEVGQTDPSPIPCQACQLCLRTNLVKDQEGEETTQECIILFTTRVCPSSYTKKWDNSKQRGSPPQIAVDIDDEEGEDLVEYADNSTPNSIELEQNPEPELDRAGETETARQTRARSS